MALSKITTRALANDSVTADKVADNAITTDMVASGEIGVTDLADGAITNAKVSTTAAIAASKVDLSSIAGNVNLSSGALQIGGTTVINSSRQAFFTAATGSSLKLERSDVGHGMTAIAETATFGHLTAEGGANGGLRITALADTASTSAFNVSAYAHTPSTDGNAAVIRLRGSKKNGTGEQAIADSEDLLSIGNVGTERIIVKGNGDFQVNGTTVINSSQVGFLNEKTRIGTGATYPTDNAQLYIQRANNNPYIGFFSSDGSRNAYLQSVAGGNMIFGNQESGGWEFNNGTSGVAVISNSGALTATGAAISGAVELGSTDSTVGDLRVYDTGNNSLRIFGVGSNSFEFDLLGTGSTGKINFSQYYVGISTSNPVAPLVISNGGASGIEFHPEIANNYNRMTNYNRSSNSYNQLGIDASQIDIRPEGTRRFSVTTAGAIVNLDARADADFRVVSDSNSHMLFVDSSANKVAIGSSSYNYGSALTLHANDSGGAPTSLFLRNSGTSGGSGATIQSGYTSGYGAQIRFNGNPSSYRMASTTFATVTGDSSTQDNLQISTTGDTIVYNDLGVGHSGNPDHVLDVEASVSGDWVSQIYNTHNSNGFGLKVRAGDNGDVNSFRVAAYNNDILLNVDGGGRVTMPKQPTFTAFIYTRANWATTGLRRLPFDSTLINQGSHFNTTTNRFTAPTSGRYQFNLSLNCMGDIKVYLYKNGSVYHGGEYRSNPTNIWEHAVIESIISLSANDYVEAYVHLTGTGFAWNGGSSTWDHFSGHLIN